MADLSGLPLFVTHLVIGGTLSLLLILVTITMYRKGFWGSKKFQGEDTHITARNTQPFWSIGLAIYSSGMGTWLLFATPITGALSGLPGVLGYGLSNGLPFVLMAFLGPAVKSALGAGSRGFTVADFARERYGRPVQAVVSLTSIFFMFIFLCAELTSIGDAATALCSEYPSAAVIVGVSLVTLLYALLGGIPTTMITDRLQAGCLLVMGFTAVFAIILHVSPLLKPGTFIQASDAGLEGYITCAVLIISVTMNQFLDQSMWQRVFASRTNRDARLGLLMGAALTTPTVIAFGVTGIVAKAAVFSGILPEFTNRTLNTALFSLLQYLRPAWLGIVLFVSVALVTSTVDSIQGAIVALIAGDLMQNNLSIKWAIIGTLLLNIPAVFLALEKHSVLSLFLMSNIVSCAVVPMMFLAFWSRATPLSVGIGAGCGFLSIPITGWVITRSFVDGLLWVQLPGDVSDWTTLVTFCVVPIVTVIVTVLASYIHCHIDPDIQAEQVNRLIRMKATQGASLRSPAEREDLDTSFCSKLELGQTLASDNSLPVTRPVSQHKKNSWDSAIPTV